MPKTVDALAVIDAKTPPEVRPVHVVFGDESLLKRLVILRLRSAVQGGDEEGDFSFHRCDGEEVELRDVLDELSTVALFGGGRRLVVVDDADEFVSKHRAALEDYVNKPKATGVLVLNMESWPSNTRLFKMVDASGQAIDCSAPEGTALVKWTIAWAKTRHQVKLDRAAADSLLEIVGSQMGRIDQELAKLAASVGPGGEVTADRVDDLVGGWRVKKIWDTIDTALEGNARQALVELDKLILSGEEPIGLLAQMSATMRRFAAAGRVFEQAERQGRRLALRQVLESVGVKPFVLGKAESQLKQLGRHRALQMYGWLLETDLALKGGSSSKHRARIVLEQLIVRLSQQADPRQTAATTAR